MRVFRTFFRTLVKTFTSPSYYADILRAPFGFSLKYFFFFFFLYSAAGTAVFLVQFIHPVSTYVSDLPDAIRTIYPEELEVYIKDGLISTNVAEPYAIPITEANGLFPLLSHSGISEGLSAPVENFLVIETSGNAEDFADYKTLILMTQKSIVMADSQGTRLYTLDSLINKTITRADADALSEMITPFVKLFLPATIVLTLFGLFVFATSFYTTYLLFFAFLLFLLSKIMRAGLSYKASYKFGLHMCTITAAVLGILGLVPIIPDVPFLQTVLLLLWGFVVLSAVKKASAQPPPAGAESPTPETGTEPRPPSSP